MLQSGFNCSNTVAIGDGAMNNNNNGGASCVVIGAQTCVNAVQGDQNVFVGAEAVASSLSVEKTVAIGYQALNRGSTCSGNTVVGYQSLAFSSQFLNRFSPISLLVHVIFSFNSTILSLNSVTFTYQDGTALYIKGVSVRQQ